MHDAHKCDGICLIQPTNACTFIWPLRSHNVKHNVVLFPPKKALVSFPVLEFELWGWISEKSDRLWVHEELRSNTESVHVFSDGFIVLLPLNSIVGCTFHMLESYTCSTSFTNWKMFFAVMISFSTNIFLLLPFNWNSNIMRKVGCVLDAFVAACSGYERFPLTSAEMVMSFSWVVQLLSSPLKPLLEALL